MECSHCLHVLSERSLFCFHHVTSDKPGRDKYLFCVQAFFLFLKKWAASWTCSPVFVFLGLKSKRLQCFLRILRTDVATLVGKWTLTTKEWKAPEQRWPTSHLLDQILNFKPHELRGDWCSVDVSATNKRCFLSWNKCFSHFKDFFSLF